MSEERFKVVFSGQILDGFDQEIVRQHFSDSFRATEQLADQVFGGSAVVIKKNLEHPIALRLTELLNTLGMQSRLKPMPLVRAVDPPAPTVGDGDPPRQADPVRETDSGDSESLAAQQSHPPACPNCGSDDVRLDECQSCGVIVSQSLEQQSQVQVAERHDLETEQQLQQERLDALSTPPPGDQTLQMVWKILAFLTLVLFLGWRWYHKLQPEAFSEAELKAAYVEACYESEGCLESVEAQWDQCLGQADYARYQDADSARMLAEEEGFVERLEQCLVDENGEAMFY